MEKHLIGSSVAVACLGILLAGVARADGVTTLFTTGSPDGRMATLSQPSQGGFQETETADDFILGQNALVTGATIIGLAPTGTSLAALDNAKVEIELYHIFPIDSGPFDMRVPTRTNSPSDANFKAFDEALGELSVTASILNSGFTAANSVVTGIHTIPNQTTGGEGPVTGEEVQYTITFATPFSIAATDHIFFRPEVGLGAANGNFLWLSTPRPGPVFTGDLQAWIRNTDLDPDWLRVGTDVVGGVTPPTFNMAFSLQGTPVQGTAPEPSSFVLLGPTLGILLWWRRPANGHK